MARYRKIKPILGVELETVYLDKAKYDIIFERYTSTGAICMRIMSRPDQDGYVEPQCTATVNMPDETHLIDVETQVFIKDWSENVGITQALLLAGVITLSDIGVVSSHDYVEACNLNMDMIHYEDEDEPQPNPDPGSAVGKPDTLVIHGHQDLLVKAYHWLDILFDEETETVKPDAPAILASLIWSLREESVSTKESTTVTYFVHAHQNHGTKKLSASYTLTDLASDEVYAFLNRQVAQDMELHEDSICITSIDKL